MSHTKTGSSGSNLNRGQYSSSYSSGYGGGSSYMPSSGGGHSYSGGESLYSGRKSYAGSSNAYLQSATMQFNGGNYIKNDKLQIFFFYLSAFALSIFCIRNAS